MEWELTECDINKDVNVTGLFHYTGLKIQVKHMDHLFLTSSQWVMIQYTG